MLGKEFGHESPASQMQYNADYQETDQEGEYFLYLRTLGFLRRNLAAYSQNVKMLAYKGLACPVLKYGSLVWDFQSIIFSIYFEVYLRSSIKKQLHS